jgi:hypothetical protein
MWIRWIRIRIRNTDLKPDAIWLVPDVLKTEELCQSGLLIDQLHLNGGGVQAVQHVTQQHTVPGKNFIYKKKVNRYFRPIDLKRRSSSAAPGLKGLILSVY